MSNDRDRGGPTALTRIRLRCERLRCKHQWSRTLNIKNFLAIKCPKCGHNRADLRARRWCDD